MAIAFSNTSDILTKSSKKTKLVILLIILITLANLGFFFFNQYRFSHRKITPKKPTTTTKSIQKPAAVVRLPTSKDDKKLRYARADFGYTTKITQLKETTSNQTGEKGFLLYTDIENGGHDLSYYVSPKTVIVIKTNQATKSAALKDLKVGQSIQLNLTYFIKKGITSIGRIVILP